jgi:hypothetical protein
MNITKYASFGVFLPVLLVTAIFSTPTQVSALSCIETGEYLTTIVGRDDTVVFTGTVTDTIETTEYTTEVLKVESAAQGYVEQAVMVYHQKHPDWGYLCSAGPSKKGETSVYIASKNDAGQYQVGTRLETTSLFAKNLATNLTAAKVTGEVLAVTPEDRANQIMSTIAELFKQITALLAEYSYWTKQ